MQDSWIQLTCPSCGNDWEANPTELPDPDDSLACPDCAESHETAEFARSKRDLEVLREFHE